MRISLIIPALNEAACLPALLANVPPEAIHEIIVVDNGSTDDTAIVAERAGARVVREPRRGYGYACAAGVAVSQGDILVFMDGDGSFVPEEIGQLTAPLVDNQADLVLGTRMRGGMATGAMPVHQHIGNQFVAALVRMIYGMQISDLGPFRAIRRDLLEQLAMCERTYGWPIEMMIKAARHHARICEIPVQYRPRLAGVSKVGGTVKGTIVATYRILRVTVRYSLR